jgi:hypothetical protein
MPTVKQVVVSNTAQTSFTYNDVTEVHCVPKVASGTGGAFNAFAASGMTLRVVYLHPTTQASTTADIGVSAINSFAMGDTWQNVTTQGLRDH